MKLTDPTDMMASVEKSLKPYRSDFETFARLPTNGRDRKRVLEVLTELKTREDNKWQTGLASGAVYNGDQAHIDFLSQVYALNSQSNPLHPDIWPSVAKFEAEIVSMTAHMLNGDPQAGVCGTVSSGGTESILLAMKTYRDWAAAEKGIDDPEIVVPTTAHAAFDKAAQYFRIRIKRVPVGSDFRADVAATEAAITPNTIALVGSAPPFPHGIVDPIESLSELARAREIGFHTDGCLGGFLLPWVEQLGYPVPCFDFRLPGVTSISADTHKYGYAVKGTSVILYRNPTLRHYQYFSVTDWPGGLYNSPTLSGSRPGALSAACWAAMVSMGESGYRESARQIMDTATWIRQQIDQMESLEVLGDPLFLIAFRSAHLNIYQVMEFMTQRGWSLNGLHLPPCVHLCVTLRHTQPGVKERFMEDLANAVEHVRQNPDAPSGIGPVYGMAATPELRGTVTEVLNWYLDTQLTV